MPGKAKPKAKGKSPASKPRKAAPSPKSKSPSASKPKASGSGTDWRQETLARVRALIRQADPDVVEEVKWRKASNAMQGVPVWSHDGILCTGETYKDKVKFTFAKGASLEDPTGLFNGDDRGSTRRAIDLREGETPNAAEFKALVQAAVAANGERKSGRP